MPNWRPERWENDFGEGFPEHEAFEAGADALLEALKKDGMPTSPMMPNVCKLFSLGDNPDSERIKVIKKPGHIVFIEEEENE